MKTSAEPLKGRINKIFVRMPDWVGTLVLATPVLKTLRENFPEAYICASSRGWSVEILKNNPYINSFFEYNSKIKSLAYHLRFLNMLKRENFDLAVILPGSFGAAFFPFLAGVRNRVGYDTDKRGFLLTHSFVDKSDKHSLECFLDLLRFTGLGVKTSNPELFFDADDLEFAEKIWKENALDGSKVIGIGPGVKGEESRKWPAEKYAAFIKKIVKLRGFSPIIFGTADDRELADRIIRDSGVRCLNLCGMTSIMQMASCVKKCVTYVSNDTGGMHIAAATGIPVVGLFGPTDTMIWGPFGRGHKIIQKIVGCNPCEYRKMKSCNSKKCMQAITVEDVLDAMGGIK